MGRQQAGPPPGIFSSPVAADMLGAWAIPALAGLAAVAAAGLWLAGVVSALAGGTRVPGSPLGYAMALAAGRARWPGAWGWAVLAVILAAVAAGVVAAGHVIGRRHGARHRVNQVARYLSSRRDRARLGPRARIAQSRRLSPGAPEWAGSPLGRVVPGGQPAGSGPEDVSVDLWGARQGKTTKRVIPAILDAPGPVLATTNKRDVSDETAAFRARRGRTWLFDPQGIASDGEPTFTYNPLAAVTDVAAAQRLAAIFEASTREPGARTDAHWDTAGRDLLAWLFLAAACAGLPIARAWEWLSNPDDAAPAALLRKAGHDGPATAVEGVLGQPDKMRGSTYGTAQRMARALVNPRLLAWVTPADELPEFAPEKFPASTDTLYALSKEGEGSGGPFVAALTAHVCEAAERLAASTRSGRLPVPLVVELDEAANIVRWPELPKLYSHYGSRGILLHSYLQSWTQAAEAWGEYGVRAMWSAATIRVLGAGVADEKFLSECSALIGDHEEWVLQSASTGRSGERQATRALRKDRAMAVSDLASMPSDRAIVFASGSRPVVIQTHPWQNGPHADAVRQAQAQAPGATPLWVAP
jgi:type IV secretory pathway TraG/TraD family ATPase VirD4